MVHAVDEPRQRNRRGEGDRLRTEIIAAAIRLLERQGDGEPFSLRAVAKEAKISPPAVYLAFGDLHALMVAVLERLFAEVEARLDAAEAGVDGDPKALLRARSLAYVRFGLAHPNTYRVLYEGRAMLRLDESTLTNFAQASADRNAQLIQALRPEADSKRLGLLLWTGLHGLVSARINKPVIVWPDVEALAMQVVDAYLGAP